MNLRLPGIPHHAVDSIQEVSVADGDIEILDLLFLVAVTNDGVRDRGVNPAPHGVRLPAVPEIMDSGSWADTDGNDRLPSDLG
jgi:hypothetical protein